MVTIGDSVSRVRGLVKGTKEDAFLTDRMIYSLLLKYGKLFIKRLDNENKIMRYQSLFKALPCVDLIDVDKVEACCSGIKSKCIIKRTKEKIPTVIDGTMGPLFRFISSIDGSIRVYRTYPATYTNIANSTNFKYNNTKYYWFIDGYLYFPNIEWDAVRIEAIWDDDISYFQCDTDDAKCTIRQLQSTSIPDYLFADIEQMVLKELGFMLQVPSDNKDDNQNPLR